MSVLELLRASKARLASPERLGSTKRQDPYDLDDLNDLSPPARTREPGDDDDLETDPKWLAEFNRGIGRPDPPEMETAPCPTTPAPAWTA